jgi:predicted Zn-dependent peptidase
MVVGEGIDLSKRALSYINCLGKHSKLVHSILEDREVVLEASHSQADHKDYLPFAFILQLCREAARSELIEGLEEQLSPNLSLLVVHTSIA